MSNTPVGVVPPGCGSRWYCIHVEGGREKQARRNLQAQGFFVYLPEYHDPRSHRQQLLFPSYLFTHFNPRRTRWSRINHTPGVIRLLGPRDAEPMPVPSAIMEQIMVFAYPEPEPVPVIAPGTPVVIDYGPLAGRTGICELVAAERVRILLEVMSTRVRVDLNRDSLRVMIP